MDRFEFSAIELCDWQSYTIHDKKLNRIVCHLLDENSEYCKEMGNKIVKLLNNQS